MERLDLVSPPENRAIESAIHLARYASVLPFVRGKRVLDAACGEGYGSALLMQAGAAEVIGVDISSEAIDKATLHFSESGATFEVLDVEKLAERFSESSFDVIVSIETIEHVKDNVAFLRGLKALAKPNAIVYITCPNDYWYFPDETQNNPFHLRKYTFKEFSSITQAVFGENVSWGWGSAALGFTVRSTQTEVPFYNSWLNFRDGSASFIVENDSLHRLNETNCSYFVGLWSSDAAPLGGGGYFPISMDGYSRTWDALNQETVVDELRTKLKVVRLLTEQLHERQLRSHSPQFSSVLNAAGFKDFERHPDVREWVNILEDIYREHRHKGLRLAATQAENHEIRENVQQLHNERDTLLTSTQHLSDEKAALLFRIRELEAAVHHMSPGYWRYHKLTNLVPRNLKTALLKVYRMFKRA